MNTINEPSHRTLRMALVGGSGGFIGRVHLLAATLDGRAMHAAGALSSNSEKARAAAADFHLPADRAYPSWQEMIECEAKRDEDERIDFVSIATPNYTHYEIARAALDVGFAVVCDKPLTTDVADAVDLARRATQESAILAVTYTYSGYPMVRLARELIARGELGEVNAVRVTYIQGGLRRPATKTGRGAWKSDPALAGPAGTLADIGTHAYHMARYVTAIPVRSLTCRLKTFSPGRQLDDYAHVVVNFANGALGTLTVSQVTHGRYNDLRLEVDGELGSLSWRQECPEQLELRRQGQPVSTFHRDPRAENAADIVRRGSRVPGGHPEGYLEAFANIYGDVFDHMEARLSGRPWPEDRIVYPTVTDGLEGVQLVDRCLASHHDNGAEKDLWPEDEDRP